MIRSFRSKGLAAFASTGDGSKLPVKNLDRLTRMLRALDAATSPQDMNLPGYRFHPLKGVKRFAADVNGNYRLTWGWDAGDAVDADVEDYH